MIFFANIRDGTEWQQPKGNYGMLLPRKTAFMVGSGCKCTYNYGGLSVQPQEFPPWMVDIMMVYMPMCGLNDMTEWPNSCNLNLYDDGNNSVGWHADDEDLFQGLQNNIRILSLSLGICRTFELKANWPEALEHGGHHKVSLVSGALCTMEGMVQKHYKHRVPKENNVSGPRINLTWRWIVQHRKKCPKQRKYP